MHIINLIVYDYRCIVYDYRCILRIPSLVPSNNSTRGGVREVQGTTVDCWWQFLVAPHTVPFQFASNPSQEILNTVEREPWQPIHSIMRRWRLNLQVEPSFLIDSYIVASLIILHHYDASFLIITYYHA